ncbi:unnamed protein product [Fusarium langsethiae]|nr:unnamed protein product [Fusarium langsethiae]
MSATPQSQEAILRTCSYHRSMYYFPFLRTNPRKVPGTLLRSSAASSLAPETPNNTALICKLPPEIITNISLLLDVKSFHCFRNASRQTRAIVNGIPQYRQVAHHGFEGIKALARTGLSHHVTYKDLHQALITEECMLCGEFGGLLFLPTCTRCCYNCLREEPELAVIESFQEECLRILNPGGTDEDVFNTSSYRYLKIQNWDIPTRMLHNSKGIPAIDISREIQSLASMQGNREAALHQGWLHYRSAACIIYPTLDRDLMKVERGVSCKGCEKAFVTEHFHTAGQGWAVPDIPSDCLERDIYFSAVGFLKHFESCEHAQRIWEDSEYGSKDTKDSQTIKNGGRHLAPAGMRRYIHWHKERLGAFLESLSAWAIVGCPMLSCSDGEEQGQVYDIRTEGSNASDKTMGI